MRCLRNSPNRSIFNNTFEKKKETIYVFINYTVNDVIVIEPLTRNAGNPKYEIEQTHSIYLYPFPYVTAERLLIVENDARFP